MDFNDKIFFFNIDVGVCKILIKHIMTELFSLLPIFLNRI